MSEWLDALPAMYKALGFSGVLLALIAFLVRWYVRQMLKAMREEKDDKRRIIEELKRCHDQREESTRESKNQTARIAIVLERNSVALNANTKSNESLERACSQIVSVMRERPCFDATPPHAHRTPLPNVGGSFQTHTA
jgi:hypothetical protein